MTEPSLEWFAITDAFEDGEPNLFSLLRWDYRFVETLWGRDDDLSKILAWAESDSKAPSARLITGEGGVGKTRLAAEAAKRLRAKGWTAGFLPRHRNDFDFEVGDKGLFLILDYAEEQPERTAAILEDLAERKTAPYPFRVLFLSRRPFAQWEGETTMLQGRFGRQEIAAPAPLSVDDGSRLIEETARNFVAQTKVPLPPLGEARRWLEAASMHRAPLYAMAAAIHAALSPKQAFGLGGGQLLKSLARRELDRVLPISKSLGLGERGLETLLALGVLADGLSEGAVEQLATSGACEGARPPFMSALVESPWWRRGRLLRLEPDPPAAAFFDLALFGEASPEGRADLPRWLFIASSENAATFGNRLARVLYDLHGLRSASGAGSHPLDERLVDMLAREPSRAVAFIQLAHADVPFWSANFAAHVALILAGTTDEPVTKAGYFNNAATYLSALGRREEALAAAREAMELYRDLARSRPEAFTPYLAGSLNNYANGLSELGRREEALAAAREAVDIRRDLARSRPEAFTPDLAMSLNNYANILSALGRREEALAAAREAVDIRRDLARSRPEAFTPDLAMSLNNYANTLSELGRREEALAAASEAVELYRDLARSRPEAFTPDLAGSLNNYAAMLSELGRREEALAAAREAMELYRDLARSRPEAFGRNFGISSNVLAGILSELGRQDEALAVLQEAAPFLPEQQ